MCFKKKKRKNERLFFCCIIHFCCCFQTPSDEQQLENMYVYVCVRMCVWYGVYVCVCVRTYVSYTSMCVPLISRHLRVRLFTHTTHTYFLIMELRTQRAFCVFKISSLYSTKNAKCAHTNVGMSAARTQCVRLYVCMCVCVYAFLGFCLFFFNILTFFNIFVIFRWKNRKERKKNFRFSKNAKNRVSAFPSVCCCCRYCRWRCCGSCWSCHVWRFSLGVVVVVYYVFA